jgi:hypothetical protein
MTLNRLASEIAKREGKKSQARIGDIREILKIVTSDIQFAAAILDLYLAKKPRKKKVKP